MQRIIFMYLTPLLSMVFFFSTASLKHLSSPAKGYDRRRVYSDGDTEDLRSADLEELALLDPQNDETNIVELNATSNAERGRRREEIQMRAPQTSVGDNSLTTPPTSIASS